MHGLGGTLADAVARARDISAFRCQWHAGAFYVAPRDAQILRQVLNAREPSPLVEAFQKRVVSRFLSCSLDAGPAAPPDDAAYRFDEERILDEFAHLGLPRALGLRATRAAQLDEEARRALEPAMAVLERAPAALAGPDGSLLAEEAARQTLRAQLAAASEALAEEFVALLDSLRGMHETGGDLDSVGSAVLYVHWMLEEARRRGETLRYGRDYAFAFINYHEHLDPLAEQGPADVYMADLPIGALPHFADDARRLQARGLRVARYEDHHPFTEAQRAGLEGLVRDGVVGFVDLSGPLHGRETAAGEMVCGTDIVYRNLIAGTAADTPGVRALVHAAHSEDFALNEDALGRTLTAVIKGGLCKVDIAQELLASLAGNDAAARLAARGWDTLVTQWDEQLADVGEDLDDSVCVLELPRAEGPGADAGGEALGDGSDMPVTGVRRTDDTCRVLVALAPPPRSDRPRVTVGRAVEHYRRRFPEADYAFYCYGASVLVARRLNPADLTLNLGLLMPALGRESDGGHAGAAACRPEANPHYPRAALPRVRRAEFLHFSMYLASRLRAAGLPVARVRDRSRPAARDMRGGARSLMRLLAIAFLLGLLLTLVLPSFRPAAVRASNEDFLPQIGDAASANAQTAEETAPE